MPEDMPHDSHVREEKQEKEAISTLGGAVVGFLGGMALKESVGDLVGKSINRVQGMAVQAGASGVVADDALKTIVGEKHLPLAKQLAEHTQEAWHGLSPDRGTAIEALEASRDKLENALREDNILSRVPGGTLTILAATTVLGAVIGYAGYKMLHRKDEQSASEPRGLLGRIEAEQQAPAETLKR